MTNSWTFSRSSTHQMNRTFDSTGHLTLVTGAALARATPLKRSGSMRKIDLQNFLDHEPRRADRKRLGTTPVHLVLEDFHATEKISDLPARLTTAGAPAGHSPVRGDLAYYAPWGNFAIFYRAFGYSAGVIHLGHIDAELDTITAHSDQIVVTIDRTDNPDGTAP